MELNNKSEEFTVNIGKQNLFSYLISSYGNINELLKSSRYILNLLNIGKIKNEKIKKTIKTSKSIIPLAIFLFDLKNKIRNYYKKDKDITEDKRDKIKALMKVSNVSRFGDTEFRLGKEINEWLLSYPKLEDIKVLGYYNFKDLKKVELIKLFDENEIIIIFLYNGTKYAYKINTIKISNKLIPLHSELYMEDYDENAAIKIKGKLIEEYIKTLDIKQNVLYYEGVIRTRYRSTEEDYKIQQINIKQFVKEVGDVLNANKKRGYIFIGKPGTGKTAILLHLEKILINYPIIYISPTSIKDYWSVEGLFAFLGFIKNCIVIFEDLDSFNFDEKSKELGLFLNYIDNMKNKMNVVYIATVNNSKKVHYSLINRRGRFDEIIDVSPPKTLKEIYEIMTTHYRLIKKDNFIKQSEIGWRNLKRIKKENFVQADVCEIVNKLCLNKENFNKKTIQKGIDAILNSKKAIRKYYSQDIKENY